MTLIYLAIAWLLGIIAADFLPIPLTLLQGAAAFGVVIAVAFRHAPGVRLAALMLCCFALGNWRYHAVQIPTTPQSVQLLAGHGTITLEGTVQGDPTWTDTNQQVVLAAQMARAISQTRRVEGRVLLTLPPHPAYHYGQRLVVTGEIQQPPTATRPGEFDYRAYLARKAIFVLMPTPQVRVLPGQVGNPVLRWLLALRDHCRAVLLRELPEPQATLANGLLLGLQAAIPPDVYATFSTTGTSHILVISGWNISIIGTMLYGIAGYLQISRRRAFLTILTTIWLYTLFVGATPTVIRAAVMGTLVVLGQRLERRDHTWTTLFAATWVMTLWDPQTLWDLGFQLSALATASLFAFGTGIKALLLKTRLRAGWLSVVREALAATLAAQILALPLILYHFGTFSLVAPLANVVLLPVVPMAMLFGFIALVGGTVWLPFGQGLAPVAYLFLAWLTEGARFFANLPYAAVQLPPFPLWLLLGYYAIVVGGWIWDAAADRDA